jgi:hypothetical protein
MAPHDRDPEIEKRKERAFERILAEALSSGARGADCPDAETLAAFYEHALAPAEVAEWRAHFAGCSRCQQTLAAMAASDPNPLSDREVKRFGELVAAASAAPRARMSRFPWYLDPRALAPFAAAAVFAGALWITVHSPGVGTYDADLHPAVSPSAPLVAENQPAPPPQSVPTQKPAARVAAQSPAQHAAISATPQPAAAAPPSPPAPAANAESAADRGSASAAMQEAAKAAPAAPAPSPQFAQEQSAAEDSTSATAASGSEAAAAPASGGVMGGMTAAPLYSTAPAKAKSLRTQASAASQAQDKNNPQIIWRFGRGGQIERSSDGGATWMAQASPVRAELLAGSAPSDAVCWLVGRAGTILRTIDGASWVAVASPPQAEQNGQPPDFTFVEARDALFAVVGTADGRRFSTSDGGKTWQPQ